MAFISSQMKKKYLYFLCVAAQLIKKVYIYFSQSQVEMDRGHVILKLLNELWIRDKMRGLPSNLAHFRNEFNKFNNTKARMLDSIYHI